jgi:hypothetical protein
MATKQGRSWKLTRATVHKQGAPRPRSNKYSASDKDERPMQGDRSKVWVGGYTRSDGVHVEGHYRKISNAA